MKIINVNNTIVITRIANNSSDIMQSYIDFIDDLDTYSHPEEGTSLFDPVWDSLSYRQVYIKKFFELLKEYYDKEILVKETEPEEYEKLLVEGLDLERYVNQELIPLSGTDKDKEQTILSVYDVVNSPAHPIRNSMIRRANRI